MVSSLKKINESAVDIGVGLLWRVTSHSQVLTQARQRFTVSLDHRVDLLIRFAKKFCGGILFSKSVLHSRTKKF